MKKTRSTFIAIALGLLFSIPYAAPIDAAAKFDDSLNLMLISKLPTCTGSNSGSSAAVSDFNGTIAWGAPVGVGGGTGVARVYCNGASWTVFAGGGGGSVSNTSQAFVLNAPNQIGGSQTINGNYATGCSTSPGPASGPVDASPGELKTATGQHTCLLFDDHWNGTGTSSPTTGLNLNNWFPGMLICNNGGAPNCGAGPGGNPTNFVWPATGWCNGTDQGCQDFISYLGGASGYVPSTPTVSGINLTHNPISRAADGSLQFSIKPYFAQNGTGAPSSFCTTIQSVTLNCNGANWIGAIITSGGIVGTNYGGYPNSINNFNATIPNAGGMVQWRMKLDDGIAQGAYPGMECDAYNGPFGWSPPNSNANFEFGYLDVANQPTWVNHTVQQPGASFRSIGQGQDNNPVQNGNGAGNDYVQTGDDGVGAGDLRNWHTFAIEWTGPNGVNANQWYYYVDGISQAVTTHFEPNNNNGITNYYCHFSQGIAADLSGQWNFHSMWLKDGSGNALQPGPYNMWISDVQFWKKPGTANP